MNDSMYVLCIAVICYALIVRGELGVWKKYAQRLEDKVRELRK